jgi:hypothetical protein
MGCKKLQTEDYFRLIEPIVNHRDTKPQSKKYSENFSVSESPWLKPPGINGKLTGDSGKTCTWDIEGRLLTIESCGYPQKLDNLYKCKRLLI